MHSDIFLHRYSFQTRTQYLPFHELFHWSGAQCSSHSTENPHIVQVPLGLCLRWRDLNLCYITQHVSRALNSIFIEKSLHLAHSKGGHVVIAPKQLSSGGPSERACLLGLCVFRVSLINRTAIQFLHSNHVTKQRKIYLSLIAGIPAVV